MDYDAKRRNVRLIGGIVGVILLTPTLAPHADAHTPPVRGRDPFVFRMILENKTQTVVCALADDLWIAFNPMNCAVERIWQGGIDYKGKVYDFSQANSVAAGDVYETHDGRILDEPCRGTLPEGWASNGASMTPDGLAFDRAGATLTTPVLDLSGVQRPILSFDEKGRTAPFDVEVSNDGGATWAAQRFESTVTINTEDVWQFNHKLLVETSDQTRLRFRQRDADNAKMLRNVRIDGNVVAWNATVNGRPTPADPVWKGYTILPENSGVVLRYALTVGEHTIDVEDRPERTPSRDGVVELTRTFRLNGCPPNVTLSIPVAPDAIKDATDARIAGDRAILSGPTAELVLRWSDGPGGVAP